MGEQLLRVLTAVEHAATAFERWQSQYRDWRDDDRTSDGVSKEERRTFFNTHQHTPENVAATLNLGWAYPQCVACGRHYSVVALFKEEWGDESWALCQPCAERVVGLLRQFPGACEAVSPPSQPTAKRGE